MCSKNVLTSDRRSSNVSTWQWNVFTYDSGRNSVCQRSIGDIMQHYRAGANHHVAADMYPFPDHRTVADPRTALDADTRCQMRPRRDVYPVPDNAFVIDA